MVACFLMTHGFMGENLVRMPWIDISGPEDGRLDDFLQLALVQTGMVIAIGSWGCDMSCGV